MGVSNLKDSIIDSAVAEGILVGNYDGFRYPIFKNVTRIRVEGEQIIVQTAQGTYTIAPTGVTHSAAQAATPAEVLKELGHFENASGNIYNALVTLTPRFERTKSQALLQIATEYDRLKVNPDVSEAEVRAYLNQSIAAVRQYLMAGSYDLQGTDLNSVQGIPFYMERSLAQLDANAAMKSDLVQGGIDFNE